MDRQTFRRILLKSAFRKRKMYESLLDTVPMLKTLQVRPFYKPHVLHWMRFYFQRKLFSFLCSSHTRDWILLMLSHPNHSKQMNGLSNKVNVWVNLMNATRQCSENILLYNIYVRWETTLTLRADRIFFSMSNIKLCLFDTDSSLLRTTRTGNELRKTPLSIHSYSEMSWFLVRNQHCWVSDWIGLMLLLKYYQQIHSAFIESSSYRINYSILTLNSCRSFTLSLIPVSA